MAQNERIELRVDTGLVDRIDHWRERNGEVSRSEAVRQLVERGLAVDPARATTLSRDQRLIVWLLTEVLERIPGQRSEVDTSFIKEALYGGHFWALDWELTGVLHSHVDEPKNVTFVVNVLDMWSFIEAAYERFSEKEKEVFKKSFNYYESGPVFPGFDGNNEPEYFSIAKFLIDQMGRFQRFKGRAMNSHSIRVPIYARMLRDFEAIRPTLVGRELSVEQVIQLIGARG